MFVFQELIRSIASLVNIVFTVLYWMLVARIILSWFGVSPYTTYNDILAALYQVTDKILLPFRRLPLQLGMMDFSPIVAFIALQFLQRVLVISLYQLAASLG